MHAHLRKKLESYQPCLDAKNPSNYASGRTGNGRPVLLRRKSPLFGHRIAQSLLQDNTAWTLQHLIASYALSKLPSLTQ